MKKLLNLLSVLTISGTAIPTTIAASPYQKEQATPLTSTPDNNKKEGDSKLWIIGVVVGVFLAGLGLAYWLFKRFVFDKYFLPKINKRRHDKLVEKARKEEAEKGDKNNKGGEE